MAVRVLVAVCLCLLGLALLASAGRPRVVSKSFVKRPASRVFEVEWDFSIFDVEFSEPLHRVYALNPCPSGFNNRVCGNASATPCVCDYTNPAVCAGTAPNTTGCNCTYNHPACTRSGTMTEGVKYHYTAPPGVIKYVGFHIDLSSPANQCKTFTLWHETLSGPMRYFLASADDFQNAQDPYYRYGLASRYGGSLMTVCPDHPGFQHGTYILKIHCRIDDLSGDGPECDSYVWFTIEDLPPAATTAPAACTLPAGVNSSTHICLRDGEYWNDAVREPGWPDTIGSKFWYFAYLIQPNPDPNEPTSVLVSTSMHGYSSFVNQFPVAYDDPHINDDTPFIESYSPYDTQGGSNCVAPNVCPNWVDFQNGYQKDNYFTLYLNNTPTWMYFAILEIDENPYILVESRPAEMWKRSYTVSLASLKRVMYMLTSFNIGHAWCHDDNMNGVQYTYPYLFDQSNTNTQGGSAFWWPLPAADPNPFYPQVAFAWVSSSQIRSRDLIYGKNDTARPNHLNFAVVARMYPNGLNEEISRISGNIDNTATCHLNLLGNLVGGAGWTFGNAPPNPTDFVAVYRNGRYTLSQNWDPNPGLGNFTEKNISEAAKDAGSAGVNLERIASLLTETVTASGSRLLDINYQLQLLRFSLPTANTFREISTTYQVRNLTVPQFDEVCYAAPGSPEFAADPCCAITRGFTSLPCVPRAQTVRVDAYDSLVSGAATCGDVNCFETYVQDVASGAQSTQLGTCARITEPANVFEWNYYRPFAECRDIFLGKIAEEPTPCFSDAECSQYGVRCDMARKNCLIPISERFRNFTTCYLNRANKLLLIQLAKNVLGRDPANEPGILTDTDLWYNNYQTNQECSDPNGFEWAIPGRSNYYFASAFKNFDMCNPTTQGTYAGLDPYPWVPWQCQKYQLAPASFSRIVSEEANCNLLTTCNWYRDFGQINPNLTTAEDTCLTYWNANGTFCGVTDNGIDYFPINATRAECTAAGRVACFHNDGTVTIEASTAVCEAMSSCSTRGGNSANCGSFGECISPTSTMPRPFLIGNLNGTRIVLSQQSYATANTDYMFNPASPIPELFYYHHDYMAPGTGACFSGFGAPPIGLACGTASQSGNMRMTVLGCLHFDITTEAACVADGKTWLANPTDQTSCETILNVPADGGQPSDHFCVRPLEPVMSTYYFEPLIYTDQNQADCLASPGGVWTPRLVWKSAIWRSSTARQMVWANATYAPRYSFGVTTTAAMDILVADILHAISDIYIFEQRSTIFCEYGRLNTALNAIDCLCSANGTETCEGASSNSAVSSACGGAAGTAFVPPASIAFADDTVTPLGGCLSFAVTVVSHIEYRTTQPEGVPSYFIDFSELAEYSFRNEHGALIGQIVGDGFSITVTGNATGFITNLAKVCMRVAPDITINYPDRYTVYDWVTVGPVVSGVKTFNLIHAVNASFNRDSGEVCGSFVLVPDEVYFPVTRAEETESLQPNIFRLAEYGLVIVLIIAYIFMIGLILFKLRYIITIRAFPFSAGVTIPLFGLYAVRLIYFSMLLSYQFVTDTGGLGPWVLVELPLLLYFATTIYFVLNWAFVTRTIKKLGKARRIQALTIRYFAIVMVILLLVFIAFLLAFAFLRPQPQTSCDGRIITINDAVPKGIAIGYRVWMGALCAFVGIAFVSYAVFILAAMAQVTSRGGNDKIAAQRERAKKNLTFMAIACSLSLFIEAVYMLVLAFYTGDRDTLNIASLIVMLVTEVTPGIGILVMLDLSELAKTAELTRTQSRMAGASRGGSTATRGTGLKSMADAVANTSTATSTEAGGGGGGSNTKSNSSASVSD